MAIQDFTEITYPLNASLTFKDASIVWFEYHCRDLRAHTKRSYKCCLDALLPFFSEIVLKEMHIGHLRDFQEWRSAKAGAYRVNQELGILQQMLRHSGRWNRISEFYKPLRVVKRKAGHSLTEEEEQKLREVAFSRKKWRKAAHCMNIMLSTTMGFGELRTLRRRDVDMTRKCVTVREGAKNAYRERTIPLNRVAYESMEWLLERWKKIGGFDDEHYILPHRPRSLNGGWLFDEPQTAMLSAFRSIREEAGLPHFRVYDCRVQAITKLLSNPAVSTQVSKEIAGHISQAMQDRYSIQRFSTKMAAVEALDASPAPVLNPEPPAASSAPAMPNPLMDPAIQAEIARQVALAIQGMEMVEMFVPIEDTAPAKSARLIGFPNGGRR